jgi:hypothetical protein
MKKNTTLTNILVMFALIAAAASIFFCAYFLNSSKIETASAADAKQFSFDSASGVYSVFEGDGKLVYQAQKDDFDFAAMKAAILSASAGEAFSFDIGAPQTALEERGGKYVMNYSSEEKMEFQSSVSHPLLDYCKAEYKWFYKKGDADYSEAAGLYTYPHYYVGSGRGVGVYSIKVRVTLTLSLGDGLEFSSSNEAEASCQILPAGSFDFGSGARAEAFYGAALRDIVPFDVRGEWILSDGADPARTLDAGVYGVYYDFVPHDGNFGRVDDVLVSVKIKPYEVRVLVDDKSSVQNKPFAELTCSPLFESLPLGKTIDDLDIELFKEAGTEAGVYRIYGSSANPNFSVLFVNAENPQSFFSVGGVYTVYPATLDVVLENGATLTIESDTGFPLGSVLVATSVAEERDAVRLNGKNYKYESLNTLRLQKEDGGWADIGAVRASLAYESGAAIPVLLLNDGSILQIYAPNAVEATNITKIGFLSEIADAPDEEAWNGATVALAISIAAEAVVLGIILRRYNRWRYTL